MKRGARGGGARGRARQFSPQVPAALVRHSATDRHTCNVDHGDGRLPVVAANDTSETRRGR